MSKEVWLLSFAYLALHCSLIWFIEREYEKGSHFGKWLLLVSRNFSRKNSVAIRLKDWFPPLKSFNAQGTLILLKFLQFLSWESHSIGHCEQSKQLTFIFLCLKTIWRTDTGMLLPMVSQTTPLLWSISICPERKYFSFPFESSNCLWSYSFIFSLQMMVFIIN